MPPARSSPLAPAERDELWEWLHGCDDPRVQARVVDVLNMSGAWSHLARAGDTVAQARAVATVLSRIRAESSSSSARSSSRPRVVVPASADDGRDGRGEDDESRTDDDDDEADWDGEREEDTAQDDVDESDDEDKRDARRRPKYRGADPAPRGGAAPSSPTLRRDVLLETQRTARTASANAPLDCPTRDAVARDVERLETLRAEGARRGEWLAVLKAEERVHLHALAAAAARAAEARDRPLAALRARHAERARHDELIDLWHAVEVRKKPSDGVGRIRIASLPN